VTGAVTPAAMTLIGGDGEQVWVAVGFFLVSGAIFGAASGLLFSPTIKVMPPGPDEIAATFD
ncbi:MAG: hypothetical protein ACREE7_11125, partial [Dongiaceae bacterium]